MIVDLFNRSGIVTLIAEAWGRFEQEVLIEGTMRVMTPQAVPLGDGFMDPASVDGGLLVTFVAELRHVRNQTHCPRKLTLNLVPVATLALSDRLVYVPGRLGARL